MVINIVKNKRRCKCRRCQGWITTKHKVEHRSNWGVSTYYHLSCYYNYAKKEFQRFRDIKNKLVRYKKHIILEELSKNNPKV